MVNPISDYSSDARDFLSDYQKKAILPAFDPEIEIVSEFNENWDRAYQMLNTYYAEGYRDQSFYLGNQWSLEELAYLNNQRRNSFTYNYCYRLISLIEGIERSNRLSMVALPIEDASNDTAELNTDLLQYVMEYGDGHEKFSTGCKDACTTGISFISPYMDYRDDPVSGDIKFHLDSFNAMIWDPFFYNRDLSDCSFVARRKYLSKTEIISLMPKQRDRIMAMSYGTRDDKFSYMPYARQWGLQKLLSWTEYWRRKWETKNVLVDIESGETTIWNGPTDRLRAIQAIHPNLQLIRKPVRTVELGIIVEGQLLYYGKDPYGIDNYPFVPIFAIYEPSYDLYNWKIQSIIRLIRDPQQELNKRRSKMVDILDSQLNSGWIAKTGAVTNQSSLFKTGQGQTIFLRPEASMDDIRRIESPNIPQGHFEMMNTFEEDTLNILGISTEMMGMAENDKIETAAVLAKMRQSAGLINLRRLFDGFAESKKYLGRIVMKMYQANFTPEKVELITKKKPTPEFYSKAFARYNIVVEEGILTETQRQSQHLQLLALKQLGINIPDGLIIKSSNIHDRKELNEILDAQAQQQNKQLEQQQQMQMQQLQVVTEGIEAKAKSDQALAMERMNKIHLDQALSAERIQKAEEDKTASELNLIKALKELQGMNLDGIAKKVQILKEIANIQTMDSQELRNQAQHDLSMRQPVAEVAPSSV